MDSDLIKISLNLLAAILAGGSIGIERTFHGRAAGFRTHALVCLASCLLMTITVFEVKWIPPGTSDLFRSDPTRMAQGIMTGIGFLGAGVIFKEGLSIRGLTTAASIWTTSAIGILFGISFYFPAILATLLTLLTLSLFRWIEMHIPSHHYANNTISFLRSHTPSQEQIKTLLNQHDFKIETISHQTSSDGMLFEYKMTIRTNDSNNLTKLAESLNKMDEVKSFNVSPTTD